MELGAADEKKEASAGTVEAWGRAADNPVGGWYGLRKGYRGRFGMYLPPLLEALGLAELTHDKTQQPDPSALAGEDRAARQRRAAARSEGRAGGRARRRGR